MLANDRKIQLLEMVGWDMDCIFANGNDVHVEDERYSAYEEITELLAEFDDELEEGDEKDPVVKFLWEVEEELDRVIWEGDELVFKGKSPWKASVRGHKWDWKKCRALLDDCYTSEGKLWKERYW